MTTALHSSPRRLAFVCLAMMAIGFAGARPVRGQDPSVRAYLEPSGTVAVGRTFVLNVEIRGAQNVAREPQLPDLSDFAQYMGSNTQSSVSVVNGRTSVALTVQYRFRALEEGTHGIPSFDVNVAGRTLTTAPLELTISPASAEAGPDPATGLGPDDLFITVEPSTRAVLEGEPFTVEYRIWTRVDVTSFGVTRVPEPEGFWVEDLTTGGQPEVEQRMRNGVQYATALVRRVALVPTGAGPRTIEPVAIEAQVRVRGGGRDPFDNFFGRSLFGSTPVTTTVTSPSLEIDVRPLPPGRPEPFSGVVGSLDVEVSLDRDSVDAGDAVTLTVRVRGEGNVRTIPEPVLELPPDFEAFPPEVSEAVSAVRGGLAGTRTWEYVLLPRAPGRREIPGVRFGYYDTGVGAYRMAEAPPLSLMVTGTMAEGPAALSRGGVEQLREDIRFIRLGPLELRRTSGGPLFTTLPFWLFFLLPLAGLGGAMALRRHQDLLVDDVAYARGRRAGRVARKRLVEARRLAEGDDGQAFHAELARALRGLVADRLNLAEAGLRIADVDGALGARGVAPSLRDDVRGFLEECDRRRFAPAGSSDEERRRLLEEAEELMGRLDRELR